MSRKKAFIQAVDFSAAELSALWRTSPAAPSSPRAPNPQQLNSLFLVRRLLLEAMSISELELARFLRGTAKPALQLRFDAFMEKVTTEFKSKKEAFEKAWPVGGASVSAPKPKTKSSTALAVRSARPNALINPAESMAELKRKMGYDVFQYIAALSRASGVSKSTLARMRNGHRVRRATMEKIRALGRLSTRTFVRKMRAPALEA